VVSAAISLMLVVVYLQVRSLACREIVNDSYRTDLCLIHAPYLIGDARLLALHEHP
jgi:hypothetical protein